MFIENRFQCNGTHPYPPGWDVVTGDEVPAEEYAEEHAQAREPLKKATTYDDKRSETK